MHVFVFPEQRGRRIPCLLTDRRKSLYCPRAVTQALAPEGMTCESWSNSDFCILDSLRTLFQKLTETVRCGVRRGTRMNRTLPLLLARRKANSQGSGWSGCDTTNTLILNSRAAYTSKSMLNTSCPGRRGILVRDPLTCGR